jgi:hypothetical protein
MILKARSCAGLFRATKRAVWLWAGLFLAVWPELRAAGEPFPHVRIGVANGCFVESVALGDELRGRLGPAGWYRLLQWGAKEADEVVAGHAVMIFEYRGQLWCYDINRGYTQLDLPAAGRENVELVAAQATRPYLDKIVPRYPLYRRDFPQEPDANPPVPSAGMQEKEIRDATLVAVRLAAFRPVTLVEFDYPKEGAKRHAAAVAFVYGGRLCIYTSAGGTVPFRAQALSVQNIRQLQELLRRMHPGAVNLKVRRGATQTGQ